MDSRETVGACARLQSSLDEFERDANSAAEAEERPDLWDQVVEVPVCDVRTILAALRSAGTGRAEAEASVLPIAMAFLDKAAGEGVFFSEDAENDTPKMDAADLYCEIARRLGHEIDAPRMLALTAYGHDLARALPLQTTGGGDGNH